MPAVLCRVGAAARSCWGWPGGGDTRCPAAGGWSLCLGGAQEHSRSVEGTENSLSALPLSCSHF